MSHKFTPDEVALARRVWEAGNVNRLVPEDRVKARELRLIESGHASNLCNDVCRGHEWAASGADDLEYMDGMLEDRAREN